MHCLIKFARKVLRLHESLPYNIVIPVCQRDGAILVRKRNETFPPVGTETIAVCILAVVNYPDMAALLADGCEHIVAAVLFCRKRLSPTVQLDGVARIVRIVDIDAVVCECPERLESYLPMYSHNLFV